MSQLKRHLTSAEQIDVSRYQFVNIERVREAAAERWPVLRERVFIAARSIIEKRVAEDDLVIQCATGYLVIFQDLSGKAAQALTETVRNELQTFFLGEGQELIRQLGVHAVSETLSVEEFTASLADVDIIDMDEPAPEATDGTDLAYTDVRYMPVWDAQREAVASFFVRPLKADPDTPQLLRSPDLALSELKPDARSDVDLSLLHQAVTALEHLMQSNTRCALIVPAGFNALANPRTRALYATALAKLPSAIRPLIWVQIKDATVNVPHLRLEETARILLNQTGKLFLHVRHDWSHWTRYESIGATALGAQFPTHFTQADHQDIERFKASAKRAQAMVYFDGVNDWATARAATRTGARLFSGRAVGELDAPVAPYRLSRAQLLSRAA